MPQCISDEAPDKHIEEVWYGIKTAFINAYQQSNKIIPGSRRNKRESERASIK